MIIKNGSVFRAEGRFEKGDIYISEDKIEAVRFAGEDFADDEKVLSGTSSGDEIIDAEGLYVIPGLTDIHFHAAVGADFCDGKPESLQKIADYELRHGVTAICPASMTFPEEKLRKIFEIAKNFRAKSMTAVTTTATATTAVTMTAGAALVGINMEGPFISPEKKGAQNEAYIHRPDAEMFRRLQEAAGGLIKLVDLAPEVDGAMECIEQLRGEVRISLAHTNADYETAKEAFERGASHVTHLYNAMPPCSHRAPGVVGAACDNENVMVELICDNVHIHPAVVRAAFRMFGDDRIILISDTMEAAGLGDGEYSLGGQKVYVRGHLATLADGTIAGSCTNLLDCVRTAVQEMKIPLGSAVKSAAVNPAKAIGIYDTFGSLEEGKTANIVLLDRKLNLVRVIKDGRVV